MSELSKDEIQRHVRIYIRVFLALAGLTVATVSVSYFHLPILPAIVIALVIATLKASLVASFFMHLFSEKRIIYAILALTVFFFFALLLLPAITSSSVGR